MEVDDAKQAQAIRQRLQAIRQAWMPFLAKHLLSGVHAGVTGIGANAGGLATIMAAEFDVAREHTVVTSDAELAYRAVFTAGEGYLVYAGTGSIAAFVDTSGELHRAGGRGVVLDDAGGGYWIAREALRRIWRREDELPGAWRKSPMAQALFAILGGDSSIFSARYLMERSRGEVGRLALVVAEHASNDELASQILMDAGAELARLASAMQRRYGERRIVVTGRASQLHLQIESAMRRALSAATVIEFRSVQAHFAAARMAAERYLAV